MRRPPFKPSARIVQDLAESEFVDDSFLFNNDVNVTCGKMLTSRGADTNYFYVVHNNNQLIVYKRRESVSQSKVVLSYTFNSTASVISAAYFKATEKLDGVLVVVRDLPLDANFISFLSFQHKAQHKAVIFPAKINYIEVCHDYTQMAEKGIKAGLNTYPHILVVGGEQCYAAMFHMGDIPEEPCENVAEPPPKCVNIFKADNKGMVDYSNDMGKGEFKKTLVDVKSLLYIFDRKTVAIGLSNGLIFFLSLRTGTIGTSTVGGRLEILNLCWQNSINDNDRCCYLWCRAKRTSDDTTYLVLFTSSVNNGECYETVWQRRFFFSPPDCDNFLFMKSLFLDPDQAFGIGITDEADPSESMNTSQRTLSGVNSIVLFVYTGRTNTRSTLKGCIFDLDCYYTKRMPSEATPDRTIAQQCGFLSFFESSRTKSLSFKPYTVLDGIVTEIRRFQRPASVNIHIDQLFYPSTLKFSLLTMSKDKVIQLDVTSLQDQTITKIEKSIVQHFEEPSEISSFLFAIGLCNSMPDHNDIVMRSCIFRILIHNNFLGLLRIVSHSSTPKEVLMFIEKWLFKELETTKTKLEEEYDRLTSEQIENIPKTTLEYLIHAQALFRRCVKIFGELERRFTAAGEDQHTINKVKAHLKVAADLVLCASAYIFGLGVDMLRHTDENVEIMNKLRIEFAKRANMARTMKQKLEIHDIFEKILDANPELSDHLEVELGSECYPPESFLSLISILPLFNISEAAKLSIMGYFAKDLDLIDKRDDYSYFDKACSHFLNDNLSDEKMLIMLNAWDADMKLLVVGRLTANPGISVLKALDDDDGQQYEEKDLIFLPCRTQEEKDKLLQLYAQLPNGLHKYNRDTLEKKRYELLIDPPAQVDDDEPEFVQKVRIDVAKIKNDLPFLFEKNAFSQEILDRCRAQANQQPKMHLEAHQSTKVIAIPAGRFSMLSEQEYNDEDDQNKMPEVFPPVEKNPTQDGDLMRTPPNKHAHLLPQLTPPSHRKIATPMMSFTTGVTPVRDHQGTLLSSALKTKEMDRIRKLTTPLSIRSRTASKFGGSAFRRRNGNGMGTPTLGASETPPSKTNTIKPTSILRPPGSVRRVFTETRIQFTEKKRVRYIPSNAENRDAQRAETSFTEFSHLDDSTASEMSQHSQADNSFEMPKNIDFEGMDSDDDDNYAEDGPKEPSPPVVEEDVSMSPKELSPVNDTNSTADITGEETPEKENGDQRHEEREHRPSPSPKESTSEAEAEEQEDEEMTPEPEEIPEDMTPEAEELQEENEESILEVQAEESQDVEMTPELEEVQEEEEYKESTPGADEVSEKNDEIEPEPEVSPPPKEASPKLETTYTVDKPQNESSGSSPREMSPILESTYVVDKTQGEDEEVEIRQEVAPEVEEEEIPEVEEEVAEPLVVEPKMSRCRVKEKTPQFETPVQQVKHKTPAKRKEPTPAPEPSPSSSQQSTQPETKVESDFLRKHLLPVVKRGRGRPRKNPLPETEETEPVVVVEKEKVKRPRKSSAASSIATEEKKVRRSLSRQVTPQRDAASEAAFEEENSAVRRSPRLRSKLFSK